MMRGSMFRGLREMLEAPWVSAAVSIRLIKDPLTVDTGVRLVVQYSL